MEVKELDALPLFSLSLSLFYFTIEFMFSCLSFPPPLLPPPSSASHLFCLADGRSKKHQNKKLTERLNKTGSSL